MGILPHPAVRCRDRRLPAFHSGLSALSLVEAVIYFGASTRSVLGRLPAQRNVVELAIHQVSRGPENWLTPVRSIAIKGVQNVMACGMLAE